MTNILDNFNTLITEFDKIYEKNSCVRIIKYKQLLDDYLITMGKKLESEKYTAPNFNPFSLLKIEDQELKHSDIIAWLFDPFGSHSQIDLFFNHFINFFSFELTYNKYDYKVIREYHGNESIIDILIYGKDFIFFIENKTKSYEGFDQTYREYRDLERLGKKMGRNKRFAIFLTPNGQKPLDEDHWLTMSYPELVSALEPSLKSIHSDYIRYFVESWLNISKNLGRAI